MSVNQENVDALCTLDEQKLAQALKLNDGGETAYAVRQKVAQL